MAKIKLGSSCNHEVTSKAHVHHLYYLDRRFIGVEPRSCQRSLYSACFESNRDPFASSSPTTS